MAGLTPCTQFDNAPLLLLTLTGVAAFGLQSLRICSSAIAVRRWPAPPAGAGIFKFQ